MKEMAVREISAKEFRRLFGPPFLRGKERGFTPLREACDPRRNPLLRGRHAFLRAGKSGLLLLDGGDTAWFSLPHFENAEGAVLLGEKISATSTGEAIGNAESARALVDKTVEIARSWGAVKISGPVSPDGCGFGLGAWIFGEGRSAPWHPARDESLPVLLEKCGFLRENTLLEMEIPVAGRKNPYRGAGDWARRRKEIRIENMPLSSRRACEIAYGASEDAWARGYPAFEHVFARAGELAKKGRAIVAAQGDAAIGWLLYVPEKRRARFLHIQVLAAFRRGICAAALLETAWDLAAQNGAQSIVASTIDAGNAASLRIAQNAGGRVLNEYGVFSRKIV